MNAKAKVTVSVGQDLVLAVDEAVKHHAASSRSAVVEEALRLWQLEQKRAQLDHDVEAYYRALSPQERVEDRNWAKIAARHAGKLWEE